MSFRDFDPSTRLRQPKQKHQEDGCYEKQIKNLIQKLQSENRAIKEELLRSKSTQKKRNVLEQFIVKTHDIAQNVEGLFRDWHVFLAGEPHERHRKKFSIEKLRRAFDDEVRQLKDLASETLLLQEEQINQPGTGEVEIRNVCDEADEEEGLLSSQLESRMLEDRMMGIRRIQGQVSDVNQIFKDLASIVQDQGDALDSIESEACAAADHAKHGALEIKKSYERQRASRERVCCLLMVVILFFTALVLTHHGRGHTVPGPTMFGNVGLPKQAGAIDRGAPQVVRQGDVHVPVMGKHPMRRRLGRGPDGLDLGGAPRRRLPQTS